MSQLKKILRLLSQLKKKTKKKEKRSDEEDSTYVPPEKKLRAKQKSVQTGVIPRRVRENKTGAELPKDQEVEKAQCIEIPTALVIQSQNLPEVEVQKQTGGDDYVEITGLKAATPPPPPQEDQPESSHAKYIPSDDLFGEFPHATGVFKDDILEEDYDMFNNEAVKELSKKVVELEKEKAKVEAECDEAD
ncbi:hypothetical protein Hanom_Chr00s000796g01661581 [Helianthus anomalus]